MSDLVLKANNWLSSSNPKAQFLARQLMLSSMPMSRVCELYLNDNEGNPQSFDLFPMLRFIYDNMPDSLLLKCSRKVLKSSMISNIIAVNMIRWNNYKILYVAPSEKQCKYFSNNYLPPRFKSPNVKKLLPNGLTKDDVFEKSLECTNASVSLSYAKDDADRLRGWAIDSVFADEIQSVNYEMIPIIIKAMALSDFGRDVYSGTPLTSDNTIDRLWNSSHTHEWTTRCGCGEWNMLTPDQNIIKMIQPKGYCCAKCGKLLDTSTGQWASISNIGARRKAFHVAMPFVPFYNQHPGRWEREIYGDVKKLDTGDIELYQVYNEIFGLSMDVGSKPITLEELKELCVLGSTKDDQGDFAIFRRGKYRYTKIATGVDWGVNSITSRTVAVCGGIRDDGIIEIWWQKIYHSTDYEGHINEIAGVVNTFNPFLGCDAGPDPYRGITLVNKTNAKRGQLIQYARIATKHNYKASPDNAWQNSRMQLHKSDCMSLIFRLLKHKQILFPQYEEMKEGIQDILNEYIESSEVGLVQQLIYSHKPDAPDDWLHGLVYCVTQLLIASRDKRIQGFSSSNGLIED